MNIARFVHDLRIAGVSLWLEGDQIRFRGAQTLSEAQRAEMKARRDEVLAYLQRTAGPRPREPGQATMAPLSFAQRRLWFLEKWHGPSALYNETALLRLDGPLDDAALCRAIGRVIERHEVLRTTYHDQAGVPVQHVHPAVPFALRRVDLAREPTRLDTEVRREIARPFDLAADPMVRGTLFSAGAAEHHLCLVMHHIACDGWSSGILISELSTLYAAFSAGRSDPLPALPIQYADFACWQAAPERRRDEAVDLAYWQDRLAGAPERISLPTDVPRAEDGFEGATVDFNIPQALAAQVAELARKHRATPYMVLLTAFFAVLHRLGGDEDLVVGSAIANRDQIELEPLVGFFVNTLALRADLSGDPGFAEALQRVSEVARGAFAHQALPFDRLITHLVPERAKAHAPLFQVMFSLQNAPTAVVDLAGLRVTRLSLPCVTSKFDLTLFLRPSDEGYLGTFEFRTSLFRPETVARMGQLFVRLLQAALANPQVPISDLALLDEAEAARLVAAAQGPKTSYPCDLDLRVVFADIAGRLPDAVAVNDGQNRLNYADLHHRALCFAQALRAAGVKPGDRVALALGRSIPMVVASLGSLMAGAVYVPLDPAHPQDRIAGILAHSGARLAVGDVPNRALPALDYAQMLSAAPLAERPEVGPLHPAYIMYTSGSTGVPKGVMVPHRAILRLVLGQDYAAFGPGHRIAGVSNPAFDAATFEIWGALLTGARLELIDRETVLAPMAFADALQSRQIDSMFLTAALFNRMAEDCPAAFGGLQSLLVGGEALSSGHIARVQRSAHPPWQIRNGYGPTECTTFASVGLVDPVGDSRISVPIGPPLANTTMMILDRKMRPCPIGVPGEIYIGGDALALGYHDDPAQTADRFVGNPFGQGRLYRTGDLGRLREDHRIDMLGRVDQLVKLRGFRIEPDEIAAVLKSHPQVTDALVMPRHDGEADLRLVAYVVPHLTVPLSDGLERWSEIFDTAYIPIKADAVEAADHFDGWVSSATGAPIPLAEMREWQARTLEELQGAKGRHILEIGAGTGLLLSHLAPDAASYVATDLSHAAIDRLACRRAARTDLGNVRILHQAAHDVGGLEGQYFDLIILNSVVQYFPDAAYLLRVLGALVPLLRDGGRIYLGDIRNLDLQHAFHTWVCRTRLGPSVSAQTLADAVSIAVADDSELVISPNLFRRINAFIPDLSCRRIASKRGRSRTEMTVFRYSAELVKGPCPVSVPAWQDWRDTSADLAQIGSVLADATGEVAMAAIPNARVYDAIGMQARAIDPEDLYALAAAAGYRLHLTIAQDARAVDALFTHADTVLVQGPGASSGADLRTMCNSPALAKTARTLRADLRALARRLLPDHMVPSAIVLLPNFPVTSNGKVARGLLLPPNSVDLHQVDRTPTNAPQTAIESAIYAIWAEVLGIDSFGTEDRFFDLGGHSLLATQVVSRMRDQLGFAPTLRAFFENPTIAALAAQGHVTPPGDQEVVLI